MSPLPQVDTTWSQVCQVLFIRSAIPHTPLPEARWCSPVTVSTMNAQVAMPNTMQVPLPIPSGTIMSSVSGHWSKVFCYNGYGAAHHHFVLVSAGLRTGVPHATADAASTCATASQSCILLATGGSASCHPVTARNTAQPEHARVCHSSVCNTDVSQSFSQIHKADDWNQCKIRTHSCRQQEMVAKQQLGTSLLPDEEQPPAAAALSAHVTAVAKQHQQSQHQQQMEIMV